MDEGGGGYSFGEASGGGKDGDDAGGVPFGRLWGPAGGDSCVGGDLNAVDRGHRAVGGDGLLIEDHQITGGRPGGGVDGEKATGGGLENVGPLGRGREDRGRWGSGRNNTLGLSQRRTYAGKEGEDKSGDDSVHGLLLRPEHGDVEHTGGDRDTVEVHADLLSGTLGDHEIVIEPREGLTVAEPLGDAAACRRRDGEVDQRGVHEDGAGGNGWVGGVGNQRRRGRGVVGVQWSGDRKGRAGCGGA